MKAVEQASLKELTSFGTEASASLLLTIESEEDILSIPAFDPARDLVLGGGSNVLFVSDVPGTVYLNRIPGIDIVHRDDDHVLIEAGAGENWHNLVLWTLQRGLCGLENLSLIPGLAGAAPIQNIGAYGVELSAVLESISAWDWKRARWVTFSRDDCRLGYRDSRFKTADADRYLITSIRLKLARDFKPRLEYAGLRQQLAKTGIDRATAKDVSDAVVRIRQRKLPDPAQIGNAGSFFKNPVVSNDTAEALTERHAALPAWADKERNTKLSAAWMIERCGFRGFRDGDAGVSDRHALVLVNYGSARGRDIAALARKVQSAVEEKFGIRLETEPRLVEFDI